MGTELFELGVRVRSLLQLPLRELRHSKSNVAVIVRGVAPLNFAGLPLTALEIAGEGKKHGDVEVCQRIGMHFVVEPRLFDSFGKIPQIADAYSQVIVADVVAWVNAAEILLTSKKYWDCGATVTVVGLVAPLLYSRLTVTLAGVAESKFVSTRYSWKLVPV